MGDQPDQLRSELLPRVLVVEWCSALCENRARVEIGVHAMKREPDRRLAVSDRPCDRARAPVFRKQSRMAVHRAEPRNRKRVGRNLPRESRAEQQVGLVHPEKRRDSWVSRCRGVISAKAFERTWTA